jgi:uncharacterized protein (TIGR03085 family)
VTFSQDERLALADLLQRTGPGSPTLCEGWQTLDLAAHLVLRERRPDAAAGMLGGPLAGRTERMRRKLAGKLGYEALIGAFRDGPPRMSVFAIPGADEAANTVEHFVHHEDVRRAVPGWAPRDLSEGLSAVLWRRLKSAGFFLRTAPVGIELVRDGAGTPSRMAVRKGADLVTVAGTPAELTMWAMGRTTAANVRFEGPEAAVAKLREWR